MTTVKEVETAIRQVMDDDLHEWFHVKGVEVGAATNEDGDTFEVTLVRTGPEGGPPLPVVNTHRLVRALAEATKDADRPVYLGWRYSGTSRIYRFDENRD